MKQRQQKDFFFSALSRFAALMSGLFLLALLAIITVTGSNSLYEARVRLDIPIENTNARSYRTPMRASLHRLLGVSGRQEKRQANRLLSSAADSVLTHHLTRNPPNPIASPHTISLWLPASALVDDVMNGRIDLTNPHSERIVSAQLRGWIESLRQQNRLALFFNWTFFTAGAATSPERAGIGVALLGSLMMMLIVALTAIPMGVGAALYLEEFAPRTQFVSVLETLINNLAAIPSIVFGILGLAIFIQWFALPRSAALVGGLTLSVMTLPTIVIATRGALASVPRHVREAALALGASHHQMVFHHVLPLALPAIMTGSIIGLSQALGETAPLLLIGMVAFIADTPTSLLDPASALPVQIFIWAGAAERGFTDRASTAILVLVLFLIVMNSLAIFIRKKFTKPFA